MTEEEYLEIADGEALFFSNPSQIPWETPGQANSFNELAHIVQYRWFREVLSQSQQFGSHLDIACGSGYGTSYLSSLQCISTTTGADLNERHLSHARVRFPHVKFLNADAQRLERKFGDDEFTFITSGQTIEHLFDPVGFIFGVSRILHPKGLFALMSPTHNAEPVCLKPKNPWHLFEFNPEFMQELLSFYFEIVKMGVERPCDSVFNIFDDIVGDSMNIPIANAIVCERPRIISDHEHDNFRSEYLLKFYRKIIAQVQEREVISARNGHFLKNSYAKIDILYGIYNPERSQMWTAPEAALKFHATKSHHSLKFKTTGSKDEPRTVRFSWAGGEKLFNVEDTKIYELNIKKHEEVIIRIEVNPPMKPPLPDIRKLGISILAID